MGEPRGGPAPGSARRVGVAAVALCLVQFMDVLGVTVVVTSLPAMLASLHAPESFGSLIATGYAMFFGGLLMLGARFGDRYGHRRTILASLAVFAVGAPVYRIEAATEAENLAEQRALEKAGFTREGVVRGIGWRDGAWRDGVWFSVLRTDLDS